MQNSNENYHQVTECRACGGHAFADWLNLDKQPLANNLIENTLDKEQKYPLEVCYCTNCQLVQLKYIVNPEAMFTNYLYYSSTSQVFRQHFEDFAHDCLDQDLIKSGDLIVDIGSNDGILLKPFKQLGAKVLGIEPSREIAKKANEDGIETWGHYFTPQIADSICAYQGMATLVTMTNVFAHVDNLQEILEGVKKILRTDCGKLIIEVPYFPKMLEDGTFDLIYHEHLSYFTHTTIAKTLNRYGFRVAKVEMVDVHGGSMRVTADLHAELPPDVPFEVDQRITDSLLFKEYPTIVSDTRSKAIAEILKIKAAGKRIYGFGAPAKASTLLNYYRLSSFHISAIIDDSPAKQGKMIPGVRIPIYGMPSPEIGGIMSEYVFIFAWNFKDSIIKRLREQGYEGKFIIPFPTLQII